MIPVNDSPWEPKLWQSELRDAFRTSAALLKHLHVNQPDACEPEDFAVLAPRSYVARMRKRDPADPLLRQVLTVVQERLQEPGFSLDPLAEHALTPGSSLIQKYARRALLITTGGCAINCRYCFRRHFPYTEHHDQDFGLALQQIAADDSLEEVILSGGDPLLLRDDKIAALLNQLINIQHIARIRIHTRIPIVLPQRITQSLLDTLASISDKQLVIVLHVNHPRELDADTQRALACLSAAGATLLNQSVLLKEVNDDAACQIELCKALFSQGVLPYYLHMPDRVTGTHHFFVDDHQAQEIYTVMQGQLPGYLLPKLVREVPGEQSKILVSDHGLLSPHE